MRAVEPAMRATSNEGTLQEIIVTATRREQTVQDIPYNISAVSGDVLDAAGVTDLNGIARLVPGLQTANVGPRAGSTNSNFIIRGLNTYDPSISYVAPNLTVPLVSTYIDEVPLFTNLQFTDIARIEVLRGPQGTLYGSGSVGGTVRVIHNAPNTEHTEFEMALRTEDTDHANHMSYAADVVFNQPIGENLAYRLSAGYETQAGFINANRAVLYTAARQPVLADPANPLTSDYATGFLKDINSGSNWHIRNALLWKISDRASLELDYHHENERSNGFDWQTPGQPSYTASNQIPLQPIDRNVDLASLTLTADAGFATLTSSSSWYLNSYRDTFDNSSFELLANNTPGYYGGFPRPTVFNFDRSDDRSFVEEIRLVSKDVGPWDWIGGFFFRNQKQFITDPEVMPGFASWSQLPGSAAAAAAYYGIPDTFGNFGNFISQFHGGINPIDQSLRDYVYNFTRNASYREFATYGEVSYKVTPEWQVTGGARAFWDRFSQNVINVLPICGASCAQNGTDPLGTNTASADRSFHDQIFKFNTSYKFTPDTTAYLTIAEGYRHGGANAVCATPNGTFLCYSDAAAAALIPYKSDTAVNYEVGFKGLAGDHRLRYSTSLFLINWKDIQLETFSPVTGTTLILNGRTARSAGFEGEITAQATDSLSFTAGYSFNDAKLTQSFIVGSFIGLDGDRLPSVARNTASLAGDYSQPAGTAATVRYHLDASYKSSVTTGLNDCDVRAGVATCPAPPSPTGRIPNYGVLNGFAVLNGSVSLLVSDRWEFRAYGTNLTNRLGITAESITTPLPRDNYQFVTRPRTVGVEVKFQYK